MQPHTDIDMLQDILLCLANKGEDITVKVLHVKGDGGIACAEYRTPEPGVGEEFLRLEAKTKNCNIQQLAVSDEVQLFERVRDSVILQRRALQKRLELGGADINVSMGYLLSF